MLFALGRAGFAPAVGIVHERHGTPGVAVLTTGAIAVAGVVLWAPLTGAANYYGDLGTIGTLALILGYMGVTIAESMNAARARKTVWVALGVVGTVVLLWPLYNSVYPVPAYPGNLLALHGDHLSARRSRAARDATGDRAAEAAFAELHGPKAE
jgi:amino acid transporter